MLDDVADVASIATVAKPVPRGTDKAALAYLEASGARDSRTLASPAAFQETG